MHIDPSEHRESKTIKTDCTAHVNLNHNFGLWIVTIADWVHNHEREIPPGGFAPRRPKEAQQETVAKYSSREKFSRDHIATILADRFPDHPLEPRQISNMINTARATARKDIEALGGDVASIISSLKKKMDEEHGWRYELSLDETQTVVGIWWQSSTQNELAKRYSDILINDNTYNRNQYGYPLNIGILIDNFGSSRNAWYAFHKSEDTDTHNWVFRCHLDSVGRPPEILVSDRHPSLIGSAKITMPLTNHFYCLNHLNGNIAQKLRPVLGPEWDNFTRDFWAAYRAVSPEEFDRLWNLLLSRYPAGRIYLEEEIYPSREHWGWAWLSTTFTAGVRTNGRVEVENRVNKALGGPKKTLFQVFNALNERTASQTAKEMVQVREVSPIADNVW